MMDDLISRKAAIDALGERPMVWSNDDEYALGERSQYDIDRLAIETVPYAQPEYKMDEWCTDCKEYDQERHCCPRFNRVIRETVEECKAEHPEPCEDAISRAEAQTALQFVARRYTVAHEAHGEGYVVWSDNLISVPDAMNALREVPSVTPKEQRWIPVTLETLPNPNSVVVVCGKKGTWDYGTYRGWHGDIHSWWWKKNTIKHVYWWMYKDDAMSLPYREEGGDK